MPPGITICPVASTTRLAESAVSVPGEPSAAMVSPATATSALTTPCGVTTSPPRMIRSNIKPPVATKRVGRNSASVFRRFHCRSAHYAIAIAPYELELSKTWMPGTSPGMTELFERLTQTLIHAVFVSVQLRNEAAGFQAVGQPRESLP